MESFILGVVSSLVASFLFVTIGWLGPAQLRNWLIKILARVTNIGITHVFPTQAEANKELSSDLLEARWIGVFASRGNELTRDSFDTVFRNSSALESIRIMLPNPDIDSSDSWLSRRESEVAQHDPGFHSGLLANQVRNNIAYIAERIASLSDAQIKLYDFPHLCRIVVTDRVAYLTIYTAGSHGRNSPCLVFRRPAIMYEFVTRIFWSAWRDAIPPTSSPDSASQDG